MCLLMGAGALGLGAGGTAAAGATAAATTLQTIGTIAGIAAPIITGITSYQAAEATSDAIEDQKRTDAILTSVRDQRTRQQFRSQINSQRAEIASRGLDLASPTAVFLGQTAAKELAFASQSVRQEGHARQVELTNAQRNVEAQGMQALLRGGFGAAGQFLTAAPDLWPELLA